MYNLLEHSGNCSMKSEILWNFSRDEVHGDPIENDDAVNYRINNNKTTTSKSFEYNTKRIGSTPDNNSTLDKEVAVPLIYLSNFWRSLHLPFINCKIELELTWPKSCVIFEISRTRDVAANPNANSPVQAALAT